MPLFRRRFKAWLEAACQTFGWPPPDEPWLESVRTRLSEEVTRWIGWALHEDIIIEDGYLFRLKGSAPHKGPYRWFSQSLWRGGPHPNWEYFVQVAYYARLWASTEHDEVILTFEDHLMDITVRMADGRLWCIEVKEQQRIAAKLEADYAQRMGQIGVNHEARDRGKDSLRKAKYLVKHRPDFLSLIAIDWERHFAVAYRDANHFELHESSAPIRSS